MRGRRASARAARRYKTRFGPRGWFRSFSSSVLVQFSEISTNYIAHFIDQNIYLYGFLYAYYDLINSQCNDP